MFASRFLLIFNGFGTPKCLENHYFFQVKKKGKFSENHCFFLSKINVFQVLGYQKLHQNRSKNTFEKQVVWKSNLKRIVGRFLRSLGTKVAPNGVRKRLGKNIENQVPKWPPRAYGKPRISVPEPKSGPPYSIIKHISLYINIRLVWHARHAKAVRRILGGFWDPGIHDFPIFWHHFSHQNFR